MTGFFMAWQMFLWIPCPVTKWDDSKKKEMLLWLPAIGIIVGALWYLIFFLSSIANTTYSPVIAVLLSVFPWLVTGFMHLDGYMDCADAALYFGAKEKKIAILKDSHVGSFGVISAVILGVVQFAAMYQLLAKGFDEKEMIFLIIIPALSRCCSVENLFWLKSLPTSSYADLTMDVKKRYRIIPLVEGFAMLALVWVVCGFKFFEAILIGMAIEEIIIIYLRKNLGGFSGDVSGAAITAGELACLTAVAFI